MAVNFDVNISTIVSIAIGVGGTLWKLHDAATNLELKTAERHSENTAKFNTLENAHQEIKRDIQTLGATQQECQRKITETREMVIRLDEANKQRG